MLLQAVGFLTVTLFILKALHNVYYHFLRGNNLRKYGAGKGAWAVVTGASGGIGEEFAVQLARRKFNVVIISRSLERLKPVADKIEKFGVKAKCIAFDFQTPNVADYQKLATAFADLDVGVLVNNVGVNVDYPEVFLDHDQKDFEDILNANIRSLNQMTQIVLPKLISRKGGAIVNLGSQSAVLPAPMLSIYAGTKGYIASFTESLYAEYKRQGVDVLCVTPSMVVSQMTKLSRPSLAAPLPSAVVKPTLGALGGAQIVWSPYWVHALMDFVAGLLPRPFLAGKVLAMHKVVRIKAMKKRGDRKKAQ
eukprot:CAMPEP_0114560866 /NCGR_PEP_ID=MMETSP0114-20121206/11693_1 /TAXON_ID=31324 /ORGANISM="Goniomonas sp, Strain m" /LENGTH=306 /DNA_ID=CAMNT_0001746451 /DNA_START=23 /DNA_END=943 /DNA_ORIENTATION=+